MAEYSAKMDAEPISIPEDPDTCIFRCRIEVRDHVKMEPRADTHKAIRSLNQSRIKESNLLLFSGFQDPQKFKADVKRPKIPDREDANHSVSKNQAMRFSFGPVPTKSLENDRKDAQKNFRDDSELNIPIEKNHSKSKGSMKSLEVSPNSVPDDEWNQAPFESRISSFGTFGCQQV